MREIREWELTNLNNLMDVLRCRNTCSSEPDKWIWKLEKDGVYSVRSGYNYLMEMKSSQTSSASRCCKWLWNNVAVPKVQATAWRIFFRKIATKKELSRRDVSFPNSSLSCPPCGDADEIIEHVFFECSCSWDLWSSCLEWLGMEGSISNKASVNFRQFCSLVRGKNERMVLAVLWDCLVWAIWKRRNDIVFNNGKWNKDKVLGEVKSVLKLSPCRERRM